MLSNLDGYSILHRQVDSLRHPNPHYTSWKAGHSQAEVARLLDVTKLPETHTVPDTKKGDWPLLS